ncbi:DUF86 domain-containing protein [Candidatus Acetothermia bacterium]|jgi:uncharacterized protein YutE (UPF0331/DUF86 family)|nr:DUF86 domain-containing protein [Candidatus Acetothermia bacterium]MCI2431506.1 DUF86 domain-containing protein [Candidatus Acetothermia bacterium]MCI2437148.1 DUF86 domain-containing protein [Candidatus Acetothermia bacterium]
MIDGEIVTVRIAKIREYARLLAKLLRTPKDQFVQEPAYYLQAERLLEVMIQAMLDIGNHLIAGLLLKKPEGYRQVFEILVQNGILSAEFLPKAQALAGLRNLLIHEYFEIDRARLYEEAKQGLPDFERFCEAIVRFLQNPQAAP